MFSPAGSVWSLNISQTYWKCLVGWCLYVVVVVGRLWSFVLQSFGFSGWCQEWFRISCLIGGTGWTNIPRMIGTLFLLCLMWTVWHKRNQRTCEDLEISKLPLLATFSSTLFHRSSVWGFTDKKLIAEFIQYLSLWIYFCFLHSFVFFRLLCVFHEVCLFQ